MFHTGDKIRWRTEGADVTGRPTVRVAHSAGRLSAALSDSGLRQPACIRDGMICSLVLLLTASWVGTAPRQTDDVVLFQDGMERLKAGKYGTASLAFHALLSVYPESPLADRARAAIETADRMEQKRERTTLVRSIRFENARQVSPEEILDRFREREVGLAPEERCQRKDVREARDVLAELLEERGITRPRVDVAVRRHRAGTVDISFRIK
jgi:Surface antigen variable number repeat